MNLRPFLTGVGPLAEQIHDGTGLTFRGMARLTLLPMWLMGWVPCCRRCCGAPCRRATRCWAPCPAGLGSALRAAGRGRADCRHGGVRRRCGRHPAVFPGLIKQRSAGQVAAVMGLYSAALMGAVRSVPS